MRLSNLVMVGALVAAGTSLGACNLFKGTSPKNDAAALEVTLTAAEQTAVAYFQLPVCPAGAPLCQTPEVKTTIKKLDASAYAAVKGAEAAVQNTGLSASMQEKAVADAQAAIAALQDGVAALPKKGK